MSFSSSPDHARSPPNIPSQVSVLFSRDARTRLWDSLRRRRSSIRMLSHAHSWTSSVASGFDGDGGMGFETSETGSPTSFYSAVGHSPSSQLPLFPGYHDYGTVRAIGGHCLEQLPEENSVSGDLWPRPQLVECSDVLPPTLVQRERRQVWSEIFVDVFVGAMLNRLGNLLYHGLESPLWFSFILIIIWGSWLDAVEFSSRFGSADAPTSLLFAAYMACVLGMACNMGGTISSSFAGAALSSCLCLAAAYMRVVVKPPTAICQRFALSAVARELMSASFWGVLATVDLPNDVRLALVLTVLTLRHAVSPVLSALLEPCCFGDRRSRRRRQMGFSSSIHGNNNGDEEDVELGPFGRDNEDLSWYDTDLLDGRCHLLPVYEVSVSVKHFAHRMGALVMVILALSLEALVPRAGLDLGRASGLLAQRIYPLLACFLVVVVCLKALYLDLDVPGRARAHGLRRHRFARLVWIYSHLLLSAGVVVLALGMRAMIATTANSTPLNRLDGHENKKIEWLTVASLDPLFLYSKGLGVVLLSLLLVLLSHRPRWTDLLQLLVNATPPNTSNSIPFPSGGVAGDSDNITARDNTVFKEGRKDDSKDKDSEASLLQAKWEVELRRLRKLRLCQIYSHVASIALCLISAPKSLVDAMVMDHVSESYYLAPCVISALLLVGLVAVHLMDESLENRFWKLHKTLMDMPFDQHKLNNEEDIHDHYADKNDGSRSGESDDDDDGGGSSSAVLLQAALLSPNLLYR